MARPREFDTLEALDRAMELFWTNGYEATSLLDLAGGMELSKSSFYDTFGSKHDLYVMCLGRYIETVLGASVARLEADGSGREAIVETFERLVRMLATPAGARGCLLDNAAVELAPHDTQVTRQVAAGHRRLERALRHAIRRGQAAGEIPDHEANRLARYLASVRHGLMVTARTRPGRRVLREVARTALVALDRAPVSDRDPGS